MTSFGDDDGDVMAAVAKLSRAMRQLSVRCMRHLRQIKADLRKVRFHYPRDDVLARLLQM